MKKWIYICGAVIVAALILVLALLLGNQQDPATPTDTPTAPSATTPEEKGKVVIYQCDPQLAAAWKALAQSYTAQTGIPVTVVSDTSGSCDDLPGRMESDNAPTIFCLHSREELKKWQSACLDLTGSAIANALCSQDFALKTDGGIWGVAANVESYGLIYNTTLLARAGYTEGDIETFTQLKNIVQLITASKKEFGFSAFATPNLGNTAHGSLLCLLAGLSHDPDALRTFWDLYSANCSSPVASLIENANNSAFQEFLQDKAVFFLGGTWLYDEFAEKDDYELRILPVYTDDEHQDLGLYSHCTAYWCVNAASSELDRQASLDFLAWLVTAQAEQAAPVDSLQLLSPYRDAAYAANPLEAVVREYMRNERAGIEWRNCDALSKDKLAAFGQALAAYAVAPDDTHWEAVLQVLNSSI